MLSAWSGWRCVSPWPRSLGKKLIPRATASPIRSQRSRLPRSIRLPSCFRWPKPGFYVTVRADSLHLRRARGQGGRIVAARVEGMAAQQAPQGEPASTHCTVELETTDGIPGTGGFEPANRPEQRGKRNLVHADQQDQRASNHWTGRVCVVYGVSAS